MEILERESFADELIGELVPAGLDWERLVVRYPIPALVIAAVGGFFLGRRHGPEIVGAVSSFASSELSRNVGRLLDQVGD